MFEKIKDWQIFALLFIVNIAIFWPILIGGKVIVHNWILPDQYPRLAFIARALANHESTLWTDDFLSGFPIFLGAWGEHVQPLALFLLRFFNYIDVTHWLIFFNFFLGAMAMYWLARTLFLSKLAAVLAASVYVFNQWLIFYLGLLLFGSNAIPIIPLLFLSLVKIARGDQRFIWVGLFAMAWGWLSVMPDVMTYITLAGFSLAVVLDFSKPSVQRRFKVSLIYIGIALLGLALASPRILPILDFIGRSTREAGVIQETGILESYESHGYIGPNSLITALFPYFAIPYSDFIPLLSGADKLTLLYFGAFPLFLFFIFFIGWKKFSGDYLTKYFAALFLFILAILIKYIPLFWILHQLPILKYSGGTGKWSPVWFAAAAILCGSTLDKIVKIKDGRGFKRFISLSKYFVALVLLLIIAFNLATTVFRQPLLRLANDYFATHLYEQTTQRPLEHYQQLIEKTFDAARQNFSLANFHFLAPLLFLLSSFLVLYFYSKNRLGDLVFKRLVVIVTVLNFVVVWQGVYRVIPREFITQPPASVEFISRRLVEEPPYRVFRIWGGLKNYADLGLDTADLEQKTQLETAMLNLNYSLVYDIPFAGGHENIMSSRQSKIMALVGSERAPGNQTWVFDQKTTIGEKIKRFQLPQNRILLSMMNIKYVFTSFAFSQPWKKIFETKVTGTAIPVMIYENPEVLPRVYLANQVKFIKPNKETAFQELLAVKDFKKTTLIECASPQCLYAQYQSDPNDVITINEIKSGYLKLTTRIKHPRWLVYSESNLPTWEANLSQKSKAKSQNDNQLLTTNYSLQTLPIYTANYLFQTVYLPPGENEVVFSYPGILKQTGYSISNLFNRAVK